MGRCCWAPKPGPVPSLFPNKHIGGDLCIGFLLCWMGGQTPPMCSKGNTDSTTIIIISSSSTIYPSVAERVTITPNLAGGEGGRCPGSGGRSIPISTGSLGGHRQGRGAIVGHPARNPSG